MATSRLALIRRGQSGQLTIAESKRLLLLSESEGALQRRAIARAESRGWLCYHTWNSRNSAAGFYDLVAFHPERGVIVFAEFKREDGQPDAEQYEWGEAACRMQERWEGFIRMGPHPAVVPPVSYYLWRPSDWAETERVLS